jgi:pyruvate/oxaloacetate carboxyltransferase
LEKRDTKIAYYLDKVFGFPEPRRMLVILSENYAPESTSGWGLPSKDKDTCMLGYLIGKNRISEYKSALSVFIHEMIHSLLFKYKIINNKEKNSGMFEEAVLDYFVPYGMLTDRLELRKRQSVKEYYNANILGRPESKEMALQLLPVMEKYDKIFGKQTIWRFLSDNGFSRYIKKS